MAVEKDGFVNIQLTPFEVSQSMVTITQDALGIGRSEEVMTPHGPITVTREGNPEMPAMLTYHDIGLNHISCFQGLLLSSSDSPLLRKNFCFYHIDFPGSQDGALELPQELLPVTTQKLVEQVTQVAKHYKLTEVVGMGVGLGSHILIKCSAQNPGLFCGLILVSPVTLAPSLFERTWGNTILMQLKATTTADMARSSLVQRLVSKAAAGKNNGMGSDLVRSLQNDVSQKPLESLKAFLTAAMTRKEISGDLKVLKHRTLVVYGDNSSFYRDDFRAALSNLPHDQQANVGVERCGLGVCMENPQAMLHPIRLFMRALQQYGYGLEWDTA